MVHISEFSDQRVDKITDVAKIDQLFTVKVIEIDDKGRINLSVKRANPSYAGADREPRERRGGPRPMGRPDRKFGPRR